MNRDDPGDPDVCNVFTMHKSFSSEDDLAWARHGCTTAEIGCVDCKGRLARNMASHFADYAARRAELLAHPERVRDALQLGAERARAIAQKTMQEVRGKLGLWH